MTRVPSVAELVLWVGGAATIALLAVGVFTQPSHSRPERGCNEIPGLVLDGGPTTTGPRSSVGRPVAAIPRRQLGDPVQTTTTIPCKED